MSVLAVGIDNIYLCRFSINKILGLKYVHYQWNCPSTLLRQWYIAMNKKQFSQPQCVNGNIYSQITKSVQISNSDYGKQYTLVEYGYIHCINRKLNIHDVVRQHYGLDFDYSLFHIIVLWHGGAAGVKLWIWMMLIVSILQPIESDLTTS